MQKWEKERVRVIDRAIEIKWKTELNQDKEKIEKKKRERYWKIGKQRERDWKIYKDRERKRDWKIEKERKWDLMTEKGNLMTEKEIEKGKEREKKERERMTSKEGQKWG